jgi:GTP-binding protein YchF
MEIGIVGFPNVGKSSLFNALTGAAAAAENFPFTTIEPNIGVVPLPDERLNFLSQEWASAKVTPSGIRFVDIAGIVAGASQGEGLGNKFLSHIRAVDAIVHVVRCFKDENVVNVMTELDPQAAADIITTELLLADIQQCQTALERWSKKAKSGDKDAIAKCNALNDCMKAFNEGTPARRLNNIPPQIINEFQFLTAKPLMYIANTDEGEPDEALLKPLQERAASEGAALVALCTKLEAEIVQLPAQERAAYYEAAGITSPGLTRLAQTGKELLKLICFFTAGPQETRAWLIPQGTIALKAAGKIHSDIERGFIRAEIYKFKDLKRVGSYKFLQEKNLVTLEGKEYIMQDGDVAYFRFSV